MRVIYIGQKHTLLKINALRSEKQKIKKTNGVWQHAPLICDNAVHPLERAEI
jgi:hypothetical protein